MDSPYSSPLSSPIHKRQRLSSPTYDEQLADISQADLDAFDELEARLSQSSQSPKKVSQVSSQLNIGIGPTPQFIASDTLLVKPGNSSSLADDPDNPFTIGFTTARNTAATFASAPALSMLGFATASTARNGMPLDDERPSSPEEPPEQDFDSWFQPISAIPPVAFQTAAATLSTVATPSLTGFAKASNKGLIAPSSAALARAKAKMSDIWQESDNEQENPNSSASRSHVPLIEGIENVLRPTLIPSQKLSPRQALRTVQNSPSTPTPASFSRPAQPPITSTVDFISRNSKPFKSPLLSRTSAVNNSMLPGSPLNPGGRPANTSLSFITAGSPHPLASTPISAPRVSLLIASPAAFTSISTPTRPTQAITLGTGPRRNAPAPFVTPFKAGMKPGQAGRLQLEDSAEATRSKNSASTVPEKRKVDWLITERPGDGGKRVQRTGVFDLTQPPNKISLVSSGLSPQRYTTNELESFGINVAELLQISPSLAMYYSFHTSVASPLSPTTSSPPIILGPAAALDHLLDNGCTLATKPWVDNHWCLILWKLAGLVGLDPNRENVSNSKRWCWAEVMRQLFYRYERELNGGKRPALRLITTQDAPAAYPMVLCVSNITWSTGRTSDDGLPIEPHPELEVTDGWYRLRAQIDAPLARAVRRGIIRIGRKIGVAGARLSSEKKDPAEILEAYNSTKLEITGNSSHLTPWHAKLGFRTGPYISTLHSLTGDGGLVAAIDAVVVKTYPIAFIEFTVDEHGEQLRDGPRNESEEAVVHEKWKRRWDLEMSKLYREYEKRWDRYEGYIDRLERKAGSHFNPSQEDFPPDVIESIFDELDDPADATRVLAGLPPSESGWLARHIRDLMRKERRSATEELESELKHICPPRDVRSFRILIIQDACTQRRPAHRKAQLTVWDVLNLSLSEGKPAGTFEPGQRFMITNLMPTQQRAWMDCAPGAEVFMATRRDTRWTPIKSR